ncbi:MAG: DUF1194 domain-containing protein [Kiloniellales bacterium]
MRRLRAFLFLLLLPWQAAAQEGLPVDLELVLAVDASGSVDNDELRLQLSGIAVAFRSPEVLKAVAEGPYGRIAVALVLWAGHNNPKAISSWVLVHDEVTAEHFAAMVERFPRGGIDGATGIGKAIAFSARALTGNGYDGERLVVDISGDGRENPPDDWTVMLNDSRAFASSRGVSVNGLAILTEDPTLDTYYRYHVILGAGAFVEVAATYADFAEAIHRKLIREIAAPLVVGSR